MINIKTKNNLSKDINYMPYLVCALGAIFYLYEFALQVSPSVMTNQLMQDLGIYSTGLSFMSACYYYSYTPMQIPAGILYDRYGPRRLLTVAITICAIGAVFFANTHTIYVASIGRFFMGAGSAFSFTGALLLISRWFPHERFAFLAGIVQLMSSVGAIFGQTMIASAIDIFGWRLTILKIGLFGFVLAVTVYLIVRDYPKDYFKLQKEGNSSDNFNEISLQNAKNLKLNNDINGRILDVYKNRQNWLVAIYSFLTWAPITVFAALWGMPFIVSKYVISTEQASFVSILLWIGIGFGSPAIGYFSDLLKKRVILLALASILGIISTSYILYFGHNLYLLGLCLFIFGLAASGQSLGFAVIKDINKPSRIGTAIGFNNMATVAGGALLQPLVGFMLSLNWDGKILNNIPLYTISNYQFALIIMPICYILALISLIFLKETSCKLNQ